MLPAARGASAQTGGAHQPGDPLAAVPVAAAAELGVDAWGAVAALGPLVGLADVVGELLVGALAGRHAAGAVGVIGGTGDLQQLTRPLDGALLCLLRLDEPIDVHRVSVTKKAVARLRISTSSRSRRFSRRSADELLALLAGQPAVATPPGVPLGLAHPLAHRGLGQVEVPGDPPDRAVTSLAQLDDLGLELGRERPPRARLSCVPWCP